MLFVPLLLADAEALLETLRRRRLKLCTAESCTGGLIAGLLTSIAGSSDVYERGFITYSNEAKTELLGVPEALLRVDGAVSEPVARAMAEGAIRSSIADIAVSVTGIAGPEGGTPEKPVGLVFIGCSVKAARTQAHRFLFKGMDRQSVRLASVAEAIRILASAVTT
jgi:nicotinamide-nucleotide amidase